MEIAALTTTSESSFGLRAADWFRRRSSQGFDFAMSNLVVFPRDKHRFRTSVSVSEGSDRLEVHFACRFDGEAL